MNILILAAGNAAPEGNYPLCLTEFDGEPLIQQLLAACQELSPKNIIVAVPDADVKQHHLDDVISLLAPNSSVITINGITKGAACTALLAASFIDNDESLLIVNGNELIDADFATILADFKKRLLDAGVVVFKSVHPGYSYVKLDADGFVNEAAEKRPISQNATAGFYWYRAGCDFIRSAKNMIRKDASVNGSFYICPVFNELILAQKKIGAYTIDAKCYHPLKSERQIDRYEASIEREVGMKHARLEDMVKGWFVGAFSPTVLNTNDCEVAVKYYKKGDKEDTHYHKIATEITLILNGRVRMCGREWGDGDIIVLSPNEATDFEALTEVSSVVVKHPGASDDKYLGTPDKE